MQKMWLSSKVQHLSNLPYRYTIIPIILLAIVVVTILALALIPSRSFDEEVSFERFTYETMQSSQGVIIHVMRTQPQFIELQSIKMNVIESGFNGINGGFFWLEQLLSIAVMNDIPVQGVPGEYGSGWFNVKYPRGTFVYDRITREFSVQIVSSVDEIEVSDRSQYWAQGGISMNLSDEINWDHKIQVEAMPFPDDTRLRSGMIYDQEGYVYLIISTTHCTAAQFRSAMFELADDHPLVEGIFLDGDGSSQMLADTHKFIGDGRKVTQMIRVVELVQ